ncbi:restriction endonuclease [Candidatus Omnitrophus magneticus]|uniref:Restriction endonuclease n=1 Tax=Candidatus Omnitrophus magneticus TaxID=1609969 RepID=A0A0F0CQY5_9BACT|nr:restriction endonuclease [Candidatus Omnitrophus magneticus]
MDAQTIEKPKQKVLEAYSTETKVVKGYDVATLTGQDFDLTEIINGEEVVGPSPFDKHQNIEGNLYYTIRRYIQRNGLGKVYVSPLDVIFAEDFQRLQPDVLFIKKENMSIVKGWIRGVPDMVCEVISKGTISRDTVTKRAVYEQFKVPEYWIVFPEHETVQVFTLESDKYILYSTAEGEGVIKSKVIEGLELDINDVFEDW